MEGGLYGSISRPLRSLTRTAWGGSRPGADYIAGMSRRTKIGIAAAVATEVLYGCSFAFTKGVTETIDPFTLLGWRFVVALVALLALVGARVVRLSVTRATVGPLLVLAVFQPLVYYLAETFGVMRTTASEGGLIISAIPVVMLIAGAVILGSRPSGRQVVGIAVTLAGVAATVVAGGLTLGLDVLGYLLLLVAVVSYALYAAFADRYAHAGNFDKTFVMVASGALLFGGIAVGQHAASGTLGALLALPLGRPDFALAVAFLALGPTIGAFFLQNVAIGALGSTRYSTYIGVCTLAALASGSLVLGERLALGQLAGGAAILGGVYLANRRGADEPEAVPEQASA